MYSSMAEILGCKLSNGNEEEKFIELKKAYRKKMKEIHPDKNPSRYEEATEETKKLTDEWKKFTAWHQDKLISEKSIIRKYGLEALTSIGIPVVALGISTLATSILAKVTAITALACIGKALTCAAIAIGTVAGFTGTAAFAIGTGGLGLLAIGAILLIAYGVHKLKNNMTNYSSTGNQKTENTSQENIFSKINCVFFSNKKTLENKQENLKNSSFITIGTP